MRPNQIDLNLFVVFEAIYGTQNLTRAADILCLSQPAVSNALARLRRIFDDPLFVRSKTGMIPTSVAENIIGQVRQALLLMNSSLNEADIFYPEKSDKTFRINMSDLIAAMTLPSLEEMVTKDAPFVHLESYHIPREDLRRELSTGTMDFAIDAPLLHDPQLCHIPLLKEQYVCMLRRDHPFKGNELTLQDYLNFDHIHASSRRSGEGHVDIALNNLGHKRNIHLRIQHYMVAPLVALRSDMALTAPRGLVSQYDARVMTLPFTLPDLELHLYWHKSRDMDPSNRWMRQKIMDISAGLSY
ncbi:MAG: LysR family transcriptional regulator [Emcibacter sp.]|nr:LysR family transcriptional regulator [Emcibacter sp.]